MTNAQRIQELQAQFANNWYGLYLDDVFARLAVFDDYQELCMRECTGNRDYYDLDDVRAVVRNHESRNPQGRKAQVARSILAERLAEEEPLSYANHIGYSDVNPYEIVRVVSDKIIDVRRMNAERDPAWKPEMIPGGFSAHCTNQHSQRWIITSDESQPIIRLHKRQDGFFHSAQVGKFRREAKPRKFYDYNF